LPEIIDSKEEALPLPTQEDLEIDIHGCGKNQGISLSVEILNTVQEKLNQNRFQPNLKDD